MQMVASRLNKYFKKNLIHRIMYAFVVKEKNLQKRQPGLFSVFETESEGLWFYILFVCGWEGQKSFQCVVLTVQDIFSLSLFLYLLLSHTYSRFLSPESYRMKKIYINSSGSSCFETRESPFCFLLDWKEPLKCESHTAAVCRS